MSTTSTAPAPAIRTAPRPDCLLCGTAGVPLHRGLTDRLFGVPGTYGLSRCPSPACGLVWIDPEPIPEDVAKLYASYYTHQFHEARQRGLGRLLGAARLGYLRGRLGYTRGVGPAWYRALGPLVHLHPGGAEQTAMAVACLPAPKPGARLLDVGCGAGELMSRMQRHGWEVHGVDFDERAVAAAAGRGLDVRLGGLAEQRYEPGRFDVAYLGHLIEHVHDPIALLAECRRVLRPGGSVVVLTPNASSWGHRRYGADWRGCEPPRHLNIFNPATMAETLRRAGFDRVRVRTLYRGARSILSLSAALASGRPVQEVRGPLWKLRGVALQLRERLARLVDPDAGEELLASGVAGGARP